LVDPINRLLLLSYGVLTVTNPSHDALYKPVTVCPLSSAVILFPENQFGHPLRLTGATLGVPPVKARPSAHGLGRSLHWIKVKNPKAPAATREAEEDWSR
jgi:hypothetical protein